MKIVHQLLSGDVAGGQIVAVQLAAVAKQAGHDVLLVTPTDGPIRERAAEAGIETRIVVLGRSFRVDTAVRYARVLRRERADLLHTHTHLAGNVLGRVAGSVARIPVVAHMHIENAFRADAWRRVQRVLDNATARLCVRILAVSEATRAALVTQGYPPALVEVVHNGIDLTRAQPVRLADPPVVVHVGRLTAVKGQRELIEALPRVDGVRVVFVGADLERGGAYQHELEEHADRLGVRDRVVFAGPRNDVPSLLAGCEIFALPSRIEGLPLVVLEAMAQARPVVATPVGGTAEAVVDGETGVLVPPADPAALAEAIDSLVRDQARATQLGENGRRRVEQSFSVDAMNRRVLQVYEDVGRTMTP